MTEQVLISLGSNQGDSENILAAAFAALSRLGTDFRRSPLYRTSPVDCAPGTPEFINAAAVFTAAPGLTPDALLPQLKRLEAELGGPRPNGRNLPRALDLDLVLFGQRVVANRTLVVPHPRACERLFVLAPAADVAPDMAWPGTDETVAGLLASLHSAEQISPVST